MIKQVNIKTLFLASISATIILILAYMNISSAIETKMKMQKLKSSIELSMSIADLVHSLQKERGFSVGYLGAKTEKFLNNLNQQIDISNNKFKKLEQIHNRSNHDHNLYSFLDDGLYELNKLNKIRKKVSNYSIDEDSTIVYYTDVNNYFLSAVAQMTINFPVINITNMLIAYTNLLYQEELIGQERALIVSILTNKGCDTTRQMKLSNLINSENIYKNTFLLYADDDTKKFYNSALKSEAISDVDKIRNSLLNNKKYSNIKTDPDHWFKVISQKIDIIKEVDIYFINKISNLVDSNYDAITRKYYLNMLMGILALMLGIWSFIYYVLKEKKRQIELKEKNLNLTLLVDEKTSILQDQKYELERLLHSYDKNIIFSKTDLNGIIIHVSEAFCLACGYSSVELIGRPHSVLRDPDMPKSVFKDIWDTIKDDACWFGEIKNRKKDGSHYWIYAGIEPDYDRHGKQIGYFAISHDITAAKELEVAMQTKSDFLANMSHEIRTPLNAIMGFVDILHKDEKDKNKTKKLKIIKDSGISLLTIINDILDFSKIQNKKLLIEKIPYNIRESFHQIKELFFEKAKDYDVKVELFIDERVPEQSLGDVVRLKQVLTNLISNAIKFSNINSVIYIKVTFLEDKNALFCEVIDKGIGISPKKIGTIFESFTQEDSSTTRKYGGTGLGLSISKALIELMDGEIGVRSELDVGSSFYFALPLFAVDCESIDEKSKNADTDLESLQLSGRVLIVEDNKANQMLMRLLLDDFGLAFSVANDGLEAIIAVQKEKFDLILMDENMPNMNGIEATKKIKEIVSLKDIPIIAVTANALHGDKEKFLEAGMDDYLAKPIDADKLKMLLQKYL